LTRRFEAKVEARVEKVWPARHASAVWISETIGIRMPKWPAEII